MTTITIPKKLIKNNDLVVVDKKSYEKMAKENTELRLAIKAVTEGEKSLQRKNTRNLKDFLKSKS